MGSFASLGLRRVGRIKDSADELRCLEMGFESFDDIEGRRGELALISCSGRDAWPSSPGIEGSSSVKSEWLVSTFASVWKYVVDAGVGSADSTRSSVRGRDGPLDFATFFTTLAFLCRSSKLSSVDSLAVTTSVAEGSFGFDPEVCGCGCGAGKLT